MTSKKGTRAARAQLLAYVATESSSSPRSDTCLNLPEWMTRPQVAELAQVSVSYLNQAAVRGDGPPMHRIGERMVRYKRQDVLDWLERRRLQSTSA